jgi:hypothetical protein
MTIGATLYLHSRSLLIVPSRCPPERRNSVTRPNLGGESNWALFGVVVVVVVGWGSAEDGSGEHNMVVGSSKSHVAAAALGGASSSRCQHAAAAQDPKPARHAR